MEKRRALAYAAMMEAYSKGQPSIDLSEFYDLPSYVPGRKEMGERKPVGQAAKAKKKRRRKMGKASRKQNR